MRSSSINNNSPALRPAHFPVAATLFCAFTLLNHLVRADDALASAPVSPLYSFNQAPLIQIFGLPALGEARILPEGESKLSVHLQIANHFTGGANSSEAISLDGETRRLTLQWRQGLTQNREWGLELPHVSHNGGFLDRSIEEFHDVFDMPQNGRTDLSRNRIDYRYSRNGVDLVNLAQAVSGVGDVRLFFANTALRKQGYAAAWRASLKLPTGDDTKLLGSGSTDLATWLSVATLRPAEKWNLYGGAGALLMSEGNVLPQQQRHLVAFGTFGIGKRFFQKFTVNGQLDMHSPFYNDSGLRQLGEYSVQGLLGVAWEFSPKKSLMFSASEDLIVGASPDVAFNLSLTLPF